MAEKTQCELCLGYGESLSKVCENCTDKIANIASLELDRRMMATAIQGALAELNQVDIPDFHIAKARGFLITALKYRGEEVQAAVKI